MKKQQILALIMAGTLAAGMAPATMAFAESDAQTVTTDDTAAAVESDEAAEPVQDTAAPAEEGDAAAETPAEAPAEDNTADNAATQEPSQDQTDTPAADQSTDSSQADGYESGDAETQEAGEAGIATQAEENDNDPAVVIASAAITSAKSIVTAQTKKNDDPKDIAAGIVSVGESTAISASASTAHIASTVSVTTGIASASSSVVAAVCSS